MKKTVTLMAMAGMLAFVACGPGAEEKAKEQARLDSLRNDSIMKADAEREQMIQDSIARMQAAAAQAAQDTAAPDTTSAPQNP